MKKLKTKIFIFGKKPHYAKKTEKGGPLGFFNIHSVAKHEKIENKKIYFRAKISLCRKKLKGGPFGIFQHPFCCKTSEKMQGGPFGENFCFKKSLAVPKKNERGDPLVSPGMVCYAEKQEKLFWFSSLGQIVQFGAIIFCRTLKNYFGQFVWIKKVTIIVAFHFMKRRLKNSTAWQDLKIRGTYRL